MKKWNSWWWMMNVDNNKNVTKLKLKIAVTTPVIRTVTDTFQEK